MAHAIWFHAPLECLHCGARVDARETGLFTSGLNPDVENLSVEPGDLLELTLDDFMDGYFMLRDPGSDPDIRALEQWACPVCRWAEFARLDFHREDPGHYRFVSAVAVSLTPEVVGDVHFLSRRIDLWLEGNAGPETDWLADIVRPLLSQQS
jgi:hypothetical protein